MEKPHRQARRAGSLTQCVAFAPNPPLAGFFIPKNLMLFVFSDVCECVWPRRWVSVAALCCLAGAAQAAENLPGQVVDVTGRSQNAPAGVAGFADAPLARSPFQAQVLNTAQLADAGLTSLSDLPAVDASVADAYNAPGYWGGFRVRGFTLDARSNFRRDGLPINAETALLFGNVERVELLKGTSGAQAGVSAPGGLVNLVVKRPRRTDQRTLTLGWVESDTLQAALDWNQRLDEATDSGLRLNLSAERLDPQLHSAQGQRRQVALAAQTRSSSADLWEAELELTRQAQPSTPGFSLLGGRLPDAQAQNPRTNLNNQSWTQPVVFVGQVASLRWTHEFSEQWHAVAQLMGQHLRSDDRAAFPLGCSAENNYSAYCSDGSFDLYDFRSEGEKRQTTAAAWTLEGKAVLAGLRHQLAAGLQWSELRARFGPQTYQWAGVGSVDGNTQVAPAPEPNATNTNRTERSTELFVRDVLDLSATTRLWLGLRHSQLERASVATDGSEPVSYRQNFSTPWLALTQQLQPELMVYASWGQGVEMDVAPNRPSYTNAGQPLPALKSRQTELGVKHDGSRWGWGLNAFEVRQPKTSDQGACDVADSCTRVLDGSQRHRGLEATLDTRFGAWSTHASAMWLHARREGAADASLNGLVPENVAQRALRAQLGYQVSAAWSVQALLAHEGARMVLPDNSLSIPAWTTLGLASRYSWRQGEHDMLLRAGIDNLLDKRAWKESPYQYGHAYLYPLEPRTLRINLQMAL